MKRPVKNRLATLREAGVVLSQEQVGKLIGTDGATVSRHESGQRSMNKAQIDAYAKLYGVPTHEIFFIAPTEESDVDSAEEPQPAAAD